MEVRRVWKNREQINGVYGRKWEERESDFDQS